MVSNLSARLAAVVRLLPVVVGLLVGGRACGDELDAEQARVSASLGADGGGSLVVEAKGLKPETPVVFSAEVNTTVHLAAGETVVDSQVALRLSQEREAVATLELRGAGEVTAVTGDGLVSWAVRRDAGAATRWLDLKVAAVAEKGPRVVNLRVVAKIPSELPAKLDVPLLAAGKAFGFSQHVVLAPAAGVEFGVAAADGFVPVENGDAREARFMASNAGDLRVEVARRGAQPAALELRGARLNGKYDPATESIAFTLAATVVVRQPGARVPLLDGAVALRPPVSGDGWHVALAKDRAAGQDLVGLRAGEFPLELQLVAAVKRDGDWRRGGFRFSVGTVVPVVIDGLDAGIDFDRKAAVVPELVGSSWRGFLPADGRAEFGWRGKQAAEAGELYFTSEAVEEVRVGGGLLRQSSDIHFKVLQGALDQVVLTIDGAGEILGVEGDNVLSWQEEAGAPRRLVVRFSRPLEASGALRVRSQAAMGAFPTTMAPLRLTPDGAMRHSGYLRAATDGGVRLEVASAAGMLQLAPGQFPGAALAAGCQQFVYRFPSANYGLSLVADRILAEVGVTEVLVYELGESDRVLNAEIELDIREAPLREWEITIPGDYAVVAVDGAAVADHAVGGEQANGQRLLKVMFREAVSGRQLVRVRLEKNAAAVAGPWQLEVPGHPGAKSVRGHVGVRSAAGYRVTAGAQRGLVEVPLAYFPRQLAGLQQAWRIREEAWQAQVEVEALERSVQADVFHLYSLKEGVAYASVLINYFVVGAPATEWRLAVPAGAGNIDIVGQSVRRDWRREGDEIIVTLHQPVLGAATLLLTFEQPMSARGGVLHPGEVRPLNVQGERGFIQVVSPTQVRHEIRQATGGLLKLEPMELPTEFRLMTSAPSLAAYQYTARPFALELGVAAYDSAGTVAQVVDFARLASHVSDAGQAVTQARYFVKTRGQKALRLALPAGVTLWEARVDGEAVTARTDAQQTVIPLPAKPDPNETVEVALRFGRNAAGGTTVLEAPVLEAPVVIGEWLVSGDRNRQLVPRGGTATLAAPGLTETGVEWLSKHRNPAMVLLAGLVLALVVRRVAAPGTLASALGLVVALAVVVGSGVLAVRALNERSINHGTLVYTAPVLKEGTPVSVEVASHYPARAMISLTGVAIGALGVALAAAARSGRLGRFGRIGRVARFAPAAAVAMVALGVLMQHVGAVVFFALLGLAVFLLAVVPEARVWLGKWRGRRGALAGGSATAALAMIGLLGMLGAQDARADEARRVAPASAAQSLIQRWEIRQNRVFAVLDVRLRANANETFELLRAPAVLTNFTGEGLRVVRDPASGRYLLAADAAGEFSGQATYEMPLGDLAAGIELPSGPAAVRELAVKFDQSGWEFTSPQAVQVRPQDGAGFSGALLMLAAGDGGVIRARAKTRDASVEEARFFVESSHAYAPAPGVVNGRHQITVRPARGEVRSLQLSVPQGFTVGEVSGGPVGRWRFDPQSGVLTVPIEPAQARAFSFQVITQRGMDALPAAIELEPLRVSGAAGEVGALALAFGGDAQAEEVTPTGLTPLNVADFSGPLPVAGAELVVHRVFRFGSEPARLAARIGEVAPEVRVVSRQRVSLGDDRLLLAVDLDVAITRSGLFRLSFELPDGLEVEAVSGAALSHWSEASLAGKRVITLHLNGRTLGDQKFALTLAGPAPAAGKGWAVPSVTLREATRQTGTLLLAPERGVQLTVAGREHVSQSDPRELGEQSPGVLAFRLLQADWRLAVDIAALDPWVTAEVLHEQSLREGQTLTRIGIHYRIDNAPVRRLRLRLAGLGEAEAATVRASGPLVGDFVRIEGDVWELRFQRGVSGTTQVAIEYQRQVERSGGGESVTPVSLVDARQVAYFVAVRGAGRLEISAGAVPRGWQAIDWSTVPEEVRDPRDRSVPAITFRAAEPDGPLPVVVARHAAANALKLRVAKANFTTLFSPDTAALTAVDLQIEVTEKSSLRAGLPDGAELFNVTVNGENAAVVRDTNGWLFNVARGADGSAARVRLVYLAPQGGSLRGPSFSVPLENVSWRVVVPQGMSLSGYRGDLEMRGVDETKSFALKDYLAKALSDRAASAASAEQELAQANSWLQAGDQQRAEEMLGRLSKNRALDEASNEDARVQLRALRTQQAVLGLNTRRQKLYLDNIGGDGRAQRNEEIERAANFNPLLQGATQYQPGQAEEAMRGNTLEENSALNGIAARLVDQQLAAEPAPAGIEVAMLERGTVYTFTRSVQVEGSEPLHLTLAVNQSTAGNFGFGLILASVVGALVFLVRR